MSGVGAQLDELLGEAEARLSDPQMATMLLVEDFALKVERVLGEEVTHCHSLLDGAVVMLEGRPGFSLRTTEEGVNIIRSANGQAWRRADWSGDREASDVIFEATESVVVRLPRPHLPTLPDSTGPGTEVTFMHDGRRVRQPVGWVEHVSEGPTACLQPADSTTQRRALARVYPARDAVVKPPWDSAFSAEFPQPSVLVRFDANNPAGAHVEFRASVGSIACESAEQLAWLRGPEGFDVERGGELEFVGSGAGTLVHRFLGFPVEGVLRLRDAETRATAFTSDGVAIQLDVEDLSPFNSKLECLQLFFTA